MPDRSKTGRVKLKKGVLSLKSAITEVPQPQARLGPGKEGNTEIDSIRKKKPA